MNKIHKFIYEKQKRRVLYSNIKKITCLIIITLLLCITPVYAGSNTIVTKSNTDFDQTKIYQSGSWININNGSSMIKISPNDTLHEPTISMTAKPSCGCRYSYTWHTHKFVDYCPHCRHYGVLKKNPKGVHEKEYTCGRCGADYCAVCGKEKYSWSHYYLRQV